MEPGSEIEVYLDQIKDYEGENKELEARNEQPASGEAAGLFQKQKDMEGVLSRLGDEEKRSEERRVQVLNLESHAASRAQSPSPLRRRSVRSMS